MMNRLRCLIPVVLCVLFSGCGALVLFGAGTAAGVAGYKYYQGALTVIFEAPFMETWDATMTALEEMKLEIKSSDHKLTSGKIKGKFDDQNPVSISFKYKTARQTEVEIRVGVLGDRDASMVIKERIRKCLLRS